MSCSLPCGTAGGEIKSSQAYSKLIVQFVKPCHSEDLIHGRNGWKAVGGQRSIDCGPRTLTTKHCITRCNVETGQEKTTLE